jgi:hypothetical protein
VKLVPNTLEAMPEVLEDGTLYRLQGEARHLLRRRRRLQGAKRELVARGLRLLDQAALRPEEESPNLYYSKATSPAWTRCSRGARKENRMDYDSAVEGLRALDRYTFQVRLKQPNYNFLYYFAYCNLTCARGARGGRVLRRQDREHPVGTGPYKLTFWKRSSKMVFEANPGSARTTTSGKRLPRVQRIEVYILEEPQPRWLAFLNAEHDMIERMPDQFANVAIPRTATLAPNLAKRGIRLSACRDGAHLLVLRDEPPGDRRLHARQDRAAPRDHHGQRHPRGDPHPAQEPGDPGAEPDRPGRCGLRPGLPQQRHRAQPRRRPRRCSTCSATWTATATATATCRARSRPIPASRW